MEKIAIIRKGSARKYKLKKNLLYKGFIIAVVLFLLCLIKNSVEKAVIIGLFGWISFSLVLLAIFFKEEYFDRKKKIKRLQSDRYNFLHDNDFEITEDLILEGIYKGYYMTVFAYEEVFRKSRNIPYDIVDAFYFPNNGEISSQKEEQMSNEYYFGNLFFKNCRVAVIPKDTKEKPDFHEILDGLVNVLQREDLNPISPKDWLIKMNEMPVTDSDTEKAEEELQ